MKRSAALFLIIIFLFNLTACGSENSAELKNRLIIQGIGLDLTKDGKLELSVQTLNTDVATHASSNSEPKMLVKLYCVTADTLSEAVKKLSELTGKNPVLSQNRIVIFGRKLAESGVGKYLDDFFRNDENRFSVLTCVCDGKAKELINAYLGENVIPARLVEKILLTADENFYITNLSILQLNNSVLNKTACAIPIAEISKEGETDSLNIIGCACFVGGKMQAVFDENTAAGINILNGKIKKAFFGVNLNDGTNVSFEILKCRTSVSTKSIDGKLSFDIKIKAMLSVDEIDSAFQNNESVEKLCQAAEDYIKALTENSIDKCIVKNKIDVFGLSRYAKRKMPELTDKNKTEAIELLRQADYNISAVFKIKRMGDSSVIF